MKKILLLPLLAFSLFSISQFSAIAVPLQVDANTGSLLQTNFNFAHANGMWKTNDAIPWTNLSGVPTLGTAAASNATAFDLAGAATAASNSLQGQITTNAASVTTTQLSGLSLVSTAVISATDSILSAIGKLQAQLTFWTTSLFGFNNAIWISYRTDGVAGTGSPWNPFDGSSTTKFTALLNTYGIMSNTVEHVGPGTYGWSNPYHSYASNGWLWGSNNIIRGAGRDITIIQNMAVPPSNDAVTMFQNPYTAGWGELHDLTLDGGFTRLGAGSTTAITAMFITGGGGMDNVHLIHFGVGTAAPFEAFTALINPSGPTSSNASTKGNFLTHVIEDNVDGSGGIGGLTIAASNTNNLPATPTYAQGTIANCVVDLGNTPGHAYGFGGFVNVVNNIAIESNNLADGYYIDSWIGDGEQISGNIAIGGQCGFTLLAASGSLIRGSHIVNNTAYINGNLNVSGFNISGTNFTQNEVGNNIVINVTTNAISNNVQGMNIGAIGAGNIFSHNILPTNVSPGQSLYQSDSSASNSLFSGNITTAGTPIIPTYSSAPPALTNNGSGTLTSLVVSSNATTPNQVGVAASNPATLINLDQLGSAFVSGALSLCFQPNLVPTTAVGSGGTVAGQTTTLPCNIWFVSPGTNGGGSTTEISFQWSNLISQRSTNFSYNFNWDRSQGVNITYSGAGNFPSSPSASTETLLVAAGSSITNANTGAGLEFRYTNTSFVSVYAFGLPSGTTNYSGGGTTPLFTIPTSIGTGGVNIGLNFSAGAYSVYYQSTNLPTGLTIPSAASGGSFYLRWGGTSRDANLSGFRKVQLNAIKGS